MEEINKFYSTYNSKSERKGFQIRQLGKETFRTIGIMISDGQGGHTGGEIVNSPTTSKDYDDHFINELIKLDPPYLLDNFLTFHFDEYKKRIDSDPDLFFKHMKYVVLERIKKFKRDAFIELISEWISRNQENLKNPSQSVTSDYFTEHDISILKQKLDELLLRVSRLELGQEITYDDLYNEIVELKELTSVLSKKTWFDVLKGKLVSFGLGKLTDQGFDLIKSIFSIDRTLNA